MKTTKKALRDAEQIEAQTKLREYFPVGSTAHTILRHKSSSGIYRAISVVSNLDGDPYDLSYLVARATGDKIDQNHGGIKAGGCGMDMGFAIVYSMSCALYRGGFECIGTKCPSNDHSNGDRNYEPHHHNDGGYAIRQRWL